MGFVGSLLGTSSGFEAKGANLEQPFTAQQGASTYLNSLADLKQQESFVKALNAQKGVKNQSSVFNQLQGVANGTGPNPAMAELANTTGQNVANQAALMAGQRGAGANAGLLARQAAMQGGAIQQQAAGQGAALQANQSLNALGQLSGIAGQQVGQQSQALNALNSQRQSEQQIMDTGISNQNAANVQMQSNMNNANEAISAQNAKSQADLVGGVMSGFGATSALGGAAKAAPMAHGGSAGYADGGAVNPEGPQSFAARYFNNIEMPLSTVSNAPSMYKVGNGLTSGLRALLSSKPQKEAPAWGSTMADYQSLPQAGGAWGSSSDDYKALPDAAPLGSAEPMATGAGDTSNSPNDEMMASRGGKVPGKAKVFGDSSVNDTVPAKLSPGEIVIPRSILQGKNPVQMAAKFVEQELLKQQKTKKKVGVANRFADGGTAEDPQKPVVVNVNNGPAPASAAPENAPQAAPQDPAAAFYAQRQAALEAKNPAFKPEAADPAPSPADQFYANRNADMQSGVPYTPGLPPTQPVTPGEPGPSLASNTTVASPGLSQGEVGAKNIGTPGARVAAPQGDMYKQAMGEQIAGARGEAAAAQQLAQAQADVARKEQDQLAQQKQSYEDHYNKLETERQKFASDIEQGHVDPNRYLGNMSTGQKFATAIGLILGGIGGGLTHQENPALRFVNSQIENDIAAQKANLDKKNSLLAMNMKQFGNLDQATNMTRVMMATQVEAKMKEAMAKASDPMAKARMQQAIGKLHETYAPIMQQQALKQAAMQQGAGADPSKLVPFLVPKEHQAKVFNEIQQAQDAATTKEAYLKHWDQAAQDVQFTKGHKPLYSTVLTPPAIKAMGPLEDALIHDEVGRVNEFEKKDVGQNHPAAWDDDKSLATKRQAISEFFDRKASAPTATAYGINIPKPQSQAPEIQSRNGIQYQKVQGGWKRVR